MKRQEFPVYSAIRRVLSKHQDDTDLMIAIHNIPPKSHLDDAEMLNKLADGKNKRVMHGNI